MRIDFDGPHLRNILLSVGLATLAVIVFFVGQRLSGPELSWDSKDYAQLGRQLARGEGRTTKLLVWELIPRVGNGEHENRPWPDVLRPPLPSTLISILFRAFGATDKTLTLWSGLFYVATVVAVYWYSLMFGRPIAFITALVFLLSKVGAVYARSGLTEPAAMFFLLMAFIVTLRMRSKVGAFLCGTILGLCYLTRPISGIWTLAFAAFFALNAGESRIKKITHFVSVFAAFASTLLVVQWLLNWNAGRGLMAINLALRVGDPWVADAAPLRFVYDNAGRFAWKWAFMTARPLVYLFQWGNIPLFSGLAVFALLLPSKNLIEGQSKKLILTILLITTAALGLLTTGDAFVGPLRYYDIFVPILLPWAISGLLVIGNLAPTRLVFGLLVCTYLAGSTYQSLKTPHLQDPVLSRAVLEDITRVVPGNETIATVGAIEAPAIAWYSDRRTISCAGSLKLDQAIAILDEKGLAPNWYVSLGDQPEVNLEKVKDWRNGLVLWRREIGRRPSPPE